MRGEGGLRAHFEGKHKFSSYLNLISILCIIFLLVTHILKTLCKKRFFAAYVSLGLFKQGTLAEILPNLYRGP